MYAVLAVKPVLECVNAATVVPPSASTFPVGEALVPQTVPLAVRAAPPLEETVAPSVAEVVAMDDAVGVVRVGAVAAAVEVTDKLSIPILGRLPLDPPVPL